MLANGDVFAGYVIERQLGRGGMGSVYLARHPRLPRMTALKLLNREMVSDEEIRARFEREADLVAQLDHPKIVTVYDRGLEDGQLWISMQYIDGIDAASVDPQRLPPERAVQIVAEVAEALDYAHGNGVLHRDVKPANMLLAKSTGGKGERVYLTDFGIARLRDDGGHLTQTGTFTATLTYASPEQLTGASLDGRSDQYSLACSLFWLFTGTGPFTATSPAAVIRGHLQGPPPTLSSVRQGLPAALDAVLLQAMAKRPDDRFATCADFAAAARRAFAPPSAPSMPVAGRGFTGQAMPHAGHSGAPVGPRPTTGPGAPVARPATGSGMPMGPRPSTGPGMPHAPHPVTGPGAPTVGPAPQPTAASVRSATPPPQPVYQQAPQYPQPGGYGYQPQPQQKSNSGTVALIVGGMVLLLVALIVIGVLTR
ncbi:serine/threonine-protein kinase [Nocardia mexicana]|uniref:non-specific serine/threonine protein kinase n=1 Tax=Nocardia mexicana TaxID=279262 RepID=A0A370HE31_9NOCA|nr:serine/threonine-protein kinase [Nocardia mexicana]RDI53133.1 serine/threonine-protein kinase [Nocardia mexicana]